MRSVFCHFTKFGKTGGITNKFNREAGFGHIGRSHAIFLIFLVNRGEVTQCVHVFHAVAGLHAPVVVSRFKCAFLFYSLETADAFYDAHPFLPAIAQTGMLGSILNSHFGVFFLIFVVDVENLGAKVDNHRVNHVSLLIHSH